MLADAINFPFVLGLGLIVLVPLLLFEVVVEAFVLKKIWQQPFSQLCIFAFFANCWSLFAGIPVKVFNGFFYSLLLPEDLSGFFSRYPFAVAFGTIVYFAVTVAVEGGYAFRLRRQQNLLITRQEIWKGIFLANLASYIVLAPLHFYLTKPGEQIREFTSNANWSDNATNQIVYIDAENDHLEMVSIGGTGQRTLVAIPMRDYLISTNLNICMFRGTNGNLYIYRRDANQTNLIWQTKERYSMNQTAFSPSGRYAAFINEQSNAVQVVDLQTSHQIYRPLELRLIGFYKPSVVWSTNENSFYVKGFESGDVLCASIQDSNRLTFDGELSFRKLAETNILSVSICYGRVGSTGSYYSYDDWGPIYNHDSCGAFSVWSEPGLGSSLRIYHGEGDKQTNILRFAVNPGLLHIAHFYFGDTAFLSDCNECVFAAENYIYVLNVSKKKIGTVAHGTRFILFTPRYQKQF